MGYLSRRSFLSASAAGAATMLHSSGALAATTVCISGMLPRFLPNSLTVTCGSRQNFALFLQNTKYMGLSGIISMTTVTAGGASYEAGSLFLLPWLKSPGKPATQAWVASRPTATTAVAMSISPIPNDAVPVNEYLSRVVLEMPAQAFIGFSVDAPLPRASAKWQWVSNVDALVGQSGVSINWSSATLNPPWFGGSRWIPGDDTCDGKTWRGLIVDGLKRASVAAC